MGGFYQSLRKVVSGSLKLFNMFEHFAVQSITAVTNRLDLVTYKKQNVLFLGSLTVSPVKSGFKKPCIILYHLENFIPYLLCQWEDNIVTLFQTSHGWLRG